MERVNSLKRKYNEQRRKPTMIDFPLLYTKAQKIIDLKETEVRSETSKHATIHR